MDHSIVSYGHRIDTLFQDLAFVEERLTRAMAEPHVDKSLVQSLDRLRKLRGMVAGIQAKHQEVTSAWSNIAAAASGQACCLHYLRTLRAVAEANGSLPHESDGLETAEDFAQKFWANDFTGNTIEAATPAPTTGGDPPAFTARLSAGGVSSADEAEQLLD